MHSPRPRLPKKPTMCTCKVGNGVRYCQRTAAVLVGFNAYCTQHAATYGIVVPAVA